MSNEEKEALVEDFGQWLLKFDCLSDNSRTNYKSWARFLMQYHDLSEIRSEGDVEKILKMQGMMMASPERRIYKGKRDYTNFKSTLRRFLQFITSWRVTQEEMARKRSYDEMIGLIEKATYHEQAKTMYEAVVFRAFKESVLLSECQKERMEKAMAKFDAKISADKLFMPGSTCNLK